MQDDLLFYLSLGVMFIFLITSLYSFDCVISKVLLAVAGIVHVIVAGFATTGNHSFLSHFSSHVTKLFCFHRCLRFSFCNQHTIEPDSIFSYHGVGH